MLEEFWPRGRWVLIRNPHWWGKPDYPDNNIDRIVHTWKRGQDNLAALVQDGIDLLQQPIYSGLAQIRSSPALKIVYRPKLLTVFFGFDQGSAELCSSDIKSKNPFKDKRVRQAVAYAIDMGAVLRPLMGELFIPAGMLIAPGVNGYAPELDQPLPYDPDRAKKLLAEPVTPMASALPSTARASGATTRPWPARVRRNSSVPSVLTSRSISCPLTS
jgi:peptide/nickel transport system substrate-binding protein